MRKRFGFAARVNVTLLVEADDESGAVEIVSVLDATGLPSPREVMEGLDLEDLDALDEAFVAMEEQTNA